MNIEYSIKVNIMDEEKMLGEDGYINNKITTKLLNIQPIDVFNQTDDFKNEIFTTMFAQKYNIFINFVEGKITKLNLKYVILM